MSVHASVQIKVLSRDCFYGWGEDHSLQAFAGETQPGPGAPGDFHGPTSARPHQAGLLHSCPKASSCASLDLSLSIAAQTAFKRLRDEYTEVVCPKSRTLEHIHPSLAGKCATLIRNLSLLQPLLTCNQAMRGHVTHPGTRFIAHLAKLSLTAT